MSKKKSKFVEVVARNGRRYRLTKNMMTPVGLPRGYIGYFMPRGEMHRVLMAILGGGEKGLAAVYSHDIGARIDFAASVHNGYLRIGCNRFNRTNTRKLARWVGVKVSW